MKLDKRHFKKYLKNELMVKAVRGVLVKIRPLIEESWTRHSTYSTLEGKAWINGKYEDAPITYTLESALSKVETNPKLKEIVEAVLCYVVYGNHWFDSDNHKTIYGFNGDQTDNKKVLEAIDQAYNLMLKMESEIVPKIEALTYVKKKKENHVKRSNN